MTSEALELAMKEATAALIAGAPPRLAAAIHHALFPGGARLRPRLTLAVGAACGTDPAAEALVSAAVAVEFFHCASLVHDDLPCFDDAALRRGVPTVHRAFGEATAVLAGDALIIGGFERVGLGFAACPERLGRVVPALGRALGARQGLVGGQGWEAEPAIDLGRYHRQKTGALFEVSAELGALAAGVDGSAFRALGALFGEAYQLLDDLADVTGTQEALGKPVDQDKAHGKPNAAARLGVSAARERARALLGSARQVVPPCPNPEILETWVESAATRVLQRVEAGS